MYISKPENHDTVNMKTNYNNKTLKCSYQGVRLGLGRKSEYIYKGKFTLLVRLALEHCTLLYSRAIMNNIVNQSDLILKSL